MTHTCWTNTWNTLLSHSYITDTFVTTNYDTLVTLIHATHSCHTHKWNTFVPHSDTHFCHTLIWHPLVTLVHKITFVTLRNTLLSHTYMPHTCHTQTSHTLLSHSYMKHISATLRNTLLSHFNKTHYCHTHTWLTHTLVTLKLNTFVRWICIHWKVCNFFL